MPDDQARCLTYILNDTSNAHFGKVRNIAGYGPADFQSAYAIAAQAANSGSGETVAVIEGGGNPNLASDLAVYRSTFGLPACTPKNGCLKVLNQAGGSQLPKGNPGWGVEMSLDVDMVSANCPNCNIMVVEVNYPSVDNMSMAVDTAARLGAIAISNSYLYREGAWVNKQGSFHHPGVAITASAGDGGYGVGFPADLNTVTAVGGTSLSTANNARGWTEMVWNGSGSGCSGYVAAPSWQVAIEQQLGGCTNRADNDIAYDADPNTGVAIYDTYETGGTWGVVGGTSVSAPAIAAIYALSGNTAHIPAALAYTNASTLNDVTQGSDGSCTPTWLCEAQAGYDAPTGNGTPNGNNGLSAL